MLTNVFCVDIFPNLLYYFICTVVLPWEISWEVTTPLIRLFLSITDTVYITYLLTRDLPLRTTSNSIAIASNNQLKGGSKYTLLSPGCIVDIMVISVSYDTLDPFVVLLLFQLYTSSVLFCHLKWSALFRHEYSIYDVLE